MSTEARSPHPVVYTILYLPFGALGGFVTVPLTFLATRHGLSITEGALLNGAQLLTNWLKWLWAPIVDVTLTPRQWYVISTVCSALGVFAMAVIPLSPETLPLMLGVIAAASLINSMVGMSIEAIMAGTVAPGEQGRVSAWFQAGNLGGNGVGGGIGLLLLQTLPAPWMTGVIMGGMFLACCGALFWLPDPHEHRVRSGVVDAVRSVLRDIGHIAETRGGRLAAILCFLPVGTGAAQGVLTQSAVAAHWGAGDKEVALMQGIVAGIITAIGCFGGGWLADRLKPRPAYSWIGLGLAGVAIAMAFTPATPLTYVVWSMVYSAGVGLAYAAFTAVVLEAIGHGSGATKYNLYASLANFPIWWLGLLLGWVADHALEAYGVDGSVAMLLCEAVLGVVGVGIFIAANYVVGGKEPDTAAAV